jgi:2-amino-4-hydroxy-6-hydroxymethyldihydropteridine diphosphokinase
MRRSTERPGARRASVAFVGLGANLGDARAALDAAFVAIAGLPRTTLRAASSLYRTEPIDAGGPDYLNAVVMIETRLAPRALLDALLRIERSHGRQRQYRNAPRTLDLDLLVYGDRHIESPLLTVPHPRMHQRAFVLRPLAEVAPGLVLPRHGPVTALLARVAGQRVEPL